MKNFGAVLLAITLAACGTSNPTAPEVPQSEPQSSVGGTVSTPTVVAPPPLCRLVVWR